MKGFAFTADPAVIDKMIKDLCTKQPLKLYIYNCTTNDGANYICEMEHGLNGVRFTTTMNLANYVRRFKEDYDVTIEIFERGTIPLTLEMLEAYK